MSRLKRRGEKHGENWRPIVTFWVILLIILLSVVLRPYFLSWTGLGPRPAASATAR
jgi:hypothetical protein